MGTAVTCKDLDKYLDENKILIVGNDEVDTVLHKYTERWAYPYFVGGKGFSFPEIISTTDFAQTLNMLDYETYGQLTVIITSGLDVYNKDVNDCKFSKSAEQVTRHVMSIGSGCVYSDVYEETRPSITTIIKLIDRESNVYCWHCGNFSVQVCSDKPTISTNVLTSIMTSMRLE